MIVKRTVLTIILSVSMLLGTFSDDRSVLIKDDELFSNVGNRDSLSLSEVEAAYLDSLDKITIGWVDNSMPLCGVGEDGKLDGALKDLCEYLQIVLECPVETKNYSSYDTLMSAVENGKVDAAFPIFKEYFDDPKHLYTSSKSVYTDRFLLIYNGNFDDEVFSKAAYFDEVQKQAILKLAPDAELVECVTTDDYFNAVYSGKARSSLGCGSIMTYFISVNPIYRDLNTMTINSTINVAFGFSRSNILLSDIITKAIENMDEHFMLEVMMRHANGKVDFSFNNFLRYNTYVFVAIFVFVVVLFGVLFLMYYKNAQKHQVELQAALAEAKRSERAKTEFLSHMSHDIRTPINGIIGMLEMSEKYKDDPVKLAEFRGKIKMSSEHLLSLINDVLDMSRISSNRVVLENVPFDIRELVENCKIMVMPLCEEYKINLNEVKYISVDNQILIGSPLHIRQVLVNILSNAIKYNREGGWVKLAVSEREKDEENVDLALVISDNGIGMSDEFQKRMFEPFSREHAGMGTTYTGTGLGMPIVKEIVEKMGGTIEVKSKLGEGTTFIVTIPFRVSKQDFRKAEEEELPRDIKGVRALLVEDNELNMEIAEFMLTEAGAIVEKAENGRIAVDMIVDQNSNHYDIVLMDVMMPEMDGIAATKAIRALQDPAKKNIPIIAMTANAFTEDQKNCLEAGMNEHLAKPLEVDKVIAAIGRNVKRRHEDF